MSGRLEDLHHGHLGDITYNSEAKEWIFPRDLAETRQLRQAGEETIQLEPSVSIATGQVQPMVSRIKNTTSLLLENPELIPAGSGLLLPLAQESENVVVASDLNDPLSSDLYAFGRFEDVKQETFSRERKSKVLAIAGGQSGEAVRLIRIEEYDAKSNIHGGTRLSVLSLNQKHVGWWVDTNGPVQQVCFSESNGVPGGWLAVRKLTSITIFRPRSHERPVSQTVPRHLSAHYPGSTCSTLEMNPVVVVSAQGAHEPYYADLVFNPFRNKQLAAIDVIGTLRVWELEMTTKNRWEAVPIELTNEGDLTIHHEKLYPSDGWGRVMWAGNAHTILTVSRTSIIAHTTEINQHSSEIFETRPKIKNMPMVDPILDVRQTSNDNSSIFILTSERICLLRILAVDGDEYALKAEIASSWKHYRAEEDYTIRLSITRVENGMDAPFQVHVPATHPTI